MHAVCIYMCTCITCICNVHSHVHYMYIHNTCTFTHQMLIHVYTYMYMCTCIYICTSTWRKHIHIVTRLPRTCAYVCLCQVNVCLQVLQSSWSPGIRRCEMSTRWIILLPQLAVYIIQNNTWALTRGSLYRYLCICRGIQKRLEGRSHTHT